LHVQNIWIEVTKLEVVVSVFLSIEADVYREHFRRSVWWNDAIQGAVLQHFSVCNNFITRLVLEFASSFVAVMLTIKVVAADNECLVLWITRDDIRWPNLGDKWTFVHLNRLIQILPVLPIWRHLELRESTVLGSRCHTLHLIFASLDHLRHDAKLSLIASQFHVPTHDCLVLVRLELVEEHALDFDLGMATIRYSWWIHTSNEEILIVLKGIVNVTIMQSAILGILLTVAGD